ncbi:MAG: hypothetical protein ACRDP6_08085 [Actinoallomurus sp.]
MTADPRTSLMASLKAAPDATSALVALGHALAWAIGSLRAVDLTDEVAVFRQVGASSDAFAHVGSLVEALAPLIDSEVVGAMVQQRLTRSGAELTKTREEVVRAGSELAVLRQREADLRAAAAEHADLSGRCAELRRMTELAGELPALRVRLAELEAGAAAVHDEVGEAENELRREADRLVRFTEEQRALLAPDLRRLTDEAARAEADLMTERARHRELEASLAADLADFERLRADHGKLPSLEAYAAAQRELVDGFARLDPPDPEDPGQTPPARASAAIADVERRLTDLDAVLKPVLERHSAAYETARSLLTWTS